MLDWSEGSEGSIDWIDLIWFMCCNEKIVYFTYFCSNFKKNIFISCKYYTIVLKSLLLIHLVFILILLIFIIIFIIIFITSFYLHDYFSFSPFYLMSFNYFIIVVRCYSIVAVQFSKNIFTILKEYLYDSQRIFLKFLKNIFLILKKSLKYTGLWPQLILFWGASFE